MLSQDVYPVFVDPEISTQANGDQCSRVPVPLLEDPYEAIRQAYLVETDAESEPFKDLVETKTLESPHTVASPITLPDSTPPVCHVEELEDSDMSGARSTSSDSTAPLLADHPLTHTSPTLVPLLRRTAHMAERIPLAMSPSLYTRITEVAAMSIQRSVRVEDEEEDEVEESSDFDCESEDSEDEGPAAGDESLAAGDEGLTSG
ncbi:hypothetical protein Tco_0070334, partial [Tanacetum coccineum]